MLLIIAATDFSEIGTNAVNYACGLASAQNAQLVIIHSYMMPVMFSDVPLPANLLDDTMHDAETQMGKLLENCSNMYPGTDITGKVVYGDFIDTVNDYAEDAVQPLMIIVGNSIAAETNNWPDSTLFDAFKNVLYPVLAVPPGAVYEPVQKLCFAFDNKHSGNHTAVSQLRNIMEQLSAELHVLNIQQDVPNQDNKPDIDEETKMLLAGTNAGFHFIYDTQDVNQAIESFIEDNEMDVLAMIPRRHSFFEGLFHKSHTKTIAHHIHIPILTLHEAGA